MMHSIIVSGLLSLFKLSLFEHWVRSFLPSHTRVKNCPKSSVIYRRFTVGGPLLGRPETQESKIFCNKNESFHGYSLICRILVYLYIYVYLCVAVSHHCPRLLQGAQSNEEGPVPGCMKHRCPAFSGNFSDASSEKWGNDRQG